MTTILHRIFKFIILHENRVNSIQFALNLFRMIKFTINIYWLRYWLPITKDSFVISCMWVVNLIPNAEAAMSVQINCISDIFGIFVQWFSFFVADYFLICVSCAFIWTYANHFMFFFYQSPCKYRNWFLPIWISIPFDEIRVCWILVKYASFSYKQLCCRAFAFQIPEFGTPLHCLNNRVVSPLRLKSTQLFCAVMIGTSINVLNFVWRRDVCGHL